VVIRVSRNAHHAQLAATPPCRTRSVTRFGVSVLKVVATIETPMSHHGAARPEVKIDADQVVVGDVVLLAAGDQVCADGRLIQATSLQIDVVGSTEPVDVTGAGDTVIAAYALGLASGLSFAEAANVANHAGGIVVMKKGTASVKLNELLESINGDGVPAIASTQAK